MTASVSDLGKIPSGPLKKKKRVRKSMNLSHEVLSLIESPEEGDIVKWKSNTGLDLEGEVQRVVKVAGAWQPPTDDSSKWTYHVRITKANKSPKEIANVGDIYQVGAAQLKK
jgi:hypothetical protein